MAEAARDWLDGGLTCEEAKRYVQNYMNVVDMRPEGEDADRKHEDDLFSDEEVDVNDIDDEAQRRVHVGGIRMEDESRETTAAVAEARRQSAEAMALSARVWGRQGRGEEEVAGEAWSRTDGRAAVSEAEVQRREAEARASQSKSSGDALAEQDSKEGHVSSHTAGGAQDLRKWRASLTGPAGERPVDLNEKQREVVEKVIGRMIE